MTSIRRPLTIDDPLAALEACHVARSAPGSTAGRLQDLALDQIRPNPKQPRRRFDENSLLALADSIRERGVLQPIIVRSRNIARADLTLELAQRAASLSWSVCNLEAEIVRSRESQAARPRPHPDHVAAAATLEHTVSRALGVDVQARPHRRGYQLLLDQAAWDRLVRLLCREGTRG